MWLQFHERKCRVLCLSSCQKSNPFRLLSKCRKGQWGPDWNYGKKIVNGLNVDRLNDSQVQWPAVHQNPDWHSHWHPFTLPSGELGPKVLEYPYLGTISHLESGHALWNSVGPWQIYICIRLWLFYSRLVKMFN